MAEPIHYLAPERGKRLVLAETRDSGYQAETPLSACRIEDLGGGRYNIHYRKHRTKREQTMLVPSTATGVVSAVVTLGGVVVFEVEPPEPPKPLPDLFSPEKGLWNDNFGRGDIDEKTDAELIESLREFGWPKGLEAIHDEYGASLTGGRREAVAKMLGIEPVIRVIKFGDGPEADAERAKVKIASNVGGKGWSPEDRQRIAATLYGDGTEFTMAEIAKRFNVATKTISRDLSGLTNVKRDPKRGGRPPTPKPAKPAPKPEPVKPEPVPADDVSAGDGYEAPAWIEAAHADDRERRNLVDQLDQIREYLTDKIAVDVDMGAGDARLPDWVEALDAVAALIAE